MKKLLIIPLMILLTGCGNTIICKTNDEQVSEIYKIKYNKNNVTTVTTEKIYKFDTKEEQKSFEGIMLHAVKTNNDKNVGVSYKTKNKEYILIQVYDVKNITDKNLTQYGLNKNKEELINNLKNNGLTCK